LSARQVSHDDKSITVDGKTIKFTKYKTPAEIPLAELGVTIVIECTGKFVTAAKLQPFLDNGAKRVVVSAPVKVRSTSGRRAAPPHVARTYA
jgi:glyceraldehyde 3-phosphate dehydrogenase